MGLLLACSYLHGEDNSLQSAFYTDLCSFRKWHVQDPLVACTFGVCGHGYAALQTPFFSVDRVGISAVATLWPREMVTSPC